MRVDEPADPVQRLGHRLPGDGVLHLVEADVAGAGEHPVAAVDVVDRPGARDAASTAVGMARGNRRPTRHTAPKATFGQQRRRRSTPGAASGSRRRSWVRRVALRQRPPRVGHPVELDVVGLVHEPVEVGEHVVDRDRLLDGVEVEGRHAPERHRRQRRRGRRARPGRRRARRRLDSACTSSTVAVGGDEAQPDDLGGEAAELGARAVGRRRDRAGDRLVGRCRPCSRGRGRDAASSSHSAAQRDAGLDGDACRRRCRGASTAP